MKLLVYCVVFAFVSVTVTPDKANGALRQGNEREDWIKENGTEWIKEMIDAKIEAIKERNEERKQEFEKLKEAIKERIEEKMENRDKLKEVIEEKIKEAIKQKIDKKKEEKEHNEALKNAAIERLQDMFDKMKEKQAEQGKPSPNGNETQSQIKTDLENLLEDTRKLIEDSLDELTAHLPTQHNEEQHMHPMLKQGIVKDDAPPPIHQDGMGAEQTPPGYDGAWWGWMNGTWFWVIHGVGAVILVLLIIAVAVLCCRKGKRANYENLA